MDTPPLKTKLDVLDRPEVLDVLFHPRRESGIPQLRPGVHTVRIKVDDNIHISGKLFTSRPNSPLLLYFHGNGEIAADYAQIAPFYTRIGLALFVVDYRGYGSSSGSPSSSALLDDAWTIYQGTRGLLEERGIRFERLFLMGRSLGSAAVLEIASRLADHGADEIAGVIIESGFAHTFPLIERIGYVRIADADEERDGFGNLRKITHVPLPTLIIHGERDVIIPVEDGRDLYDAAAATQKRLVTVAGAGHNDLMLVGHDEYFTSLARFCGVDEAHRGDDTR